MTRDGTRTSHYDFELPADRIAQQPTARRGDSRLMVVNRSTGEISHKQFSDLEQLIPPGDAIVLNTTRVESSSQGEPFTSPMTLRRRSWRPPSAALES